MGERADRHNRKALRGVVAGAVVFCAGPAVGIVGHIAGMVRSYETIESTRAPTPADLARGVRLSLVALSAGSALALIGLVIVALSLVAYFRPPDERTHDGRTA